MTEFTADVADRLQKLFDGRSRNAFARSVGIPESTFRSYFEGSSMSFENAVRIAEATGVSLAWLAHGIGEMRPADDSPVVRGALADGDEFAFIPRLDVKASAGTGALAVSEAPESMLAFRSEWLHRRGINPAAAKALTAGGDSMEPTIRDGDILLVDTSIDHVRDNGIYVVVLGGLVVVKRVHVARDGAVTLISDNGIYPPETVPAADVPNVIFAGRVMWFGRAI